METLKHDLTPMDVEHIVGFAKCLRSMATYIRENGEFTADKQTVDASKMVDVIAATGHELAGLLRQANAELGEQIKKIYRNEG